MPIAAKFGRMVTYLDELLPIKSKDPLNYYRYISTTPVKELLPVAPFHKVI